MPLDRIGAGEIAEWWDKEIEGQRDIRTGKGTLNVLSVVFRCAAKGNSALANPIPAARDTILGEMELTAEFRSKNETNLNPLNTDEIVRLLPEVEATRNPDLLLTVLLCYDAGLRIGEALGLQWADVWYGRDETDTALHVHVRRSRGNGLVGRTKSGRSRKVGMSRRLRRHLQARYMELGRAEDTS